MSDRALATVRPNDAAVFSAEEREVIRNAILPGATDADIAFIGRYARSTGLDIFARQLYVFKDSKSGKLTMQASIDGFRVVAERSQKYAGQLGPYWCGEDGQWVEVWLQNKPPAAAKVGVLRNDFAQPLWAVARTMSYAQRYRDGNFIGQWATMPDVMIAKCAESLALRRAFPRELSGIYTREEMAQAENEPAAAPIKLRKQTPTATAEVVETDVGDMGTGYNGEKVITDVQGYTEAEVALADDDTDPDNENEPATKPQINTLFALWDELAMVDGDTPWYPKRMWADLRSDGYDPQHLSRAQAAEIIKEAQDTLNVLKEAEDVASWVTVIGAMRGEGVDWPQIAELAGDSPARWTAMFDAVQNRGEAIELRGHASRIVFPQDGAKQMVKDAMLAASERIKQNG